MSLWLTCAVFVNMFLENMFLICIVRMLMGICVGCVVPWYRGSAEDDGIT